MNTDNREVIMITAISNSIRRIFDIVWYDWTSRYYQLVAWPLNSIGNVAGPSGKRKRFHSVTPHEPRMTETMVTNVSVALTTAKSMAIRNVTHLGDRENDETPIFPRCFTDGQRNQWLDREFGTNS